MQEEMQAREAALCEEQRLLQEKIEKERKEHQQEIGKLKSNAASTKLNEEQQKTQDALGKFSAKIAQQRSRAQWVRAAFRAGKDNKFELDIRVSRAQMSELQPLLVETNRIASAEKLQFKYGFHFIDALAPSASGNGDQQDGSSNKRLLLQIKVENVGKSDIQLWSIQKFKDRYSKIRSFSERRISEKKTHHQLTLDDIDGLFWDQMDHVLVGTAAIGLTPLLAFKSVREYVTLRSVAGDVTGAVEIAMDMEDCASPAKPVPGKQLLGRTVAGKITFGRLNHEAQNLSSFFVRHSWFGTDGRMTHESKADTAEDLNYTFKFQQKCDESFLKFLESGVMAMQVRAYEKVGREAEVQELRVKLKEAREQIEKMKSTGQQPDDQWLDVRDGTLQEVKTELVKARAQVFRVKHEKDALEQRLQDLEKQLAAAKQGA